MSGVAALLTPWDRGNAVELGNRRWEKRVLPVDTITYQGRQLNFTPQYLKGLEQAFRNRAYDYVPFQLADAENKHTNAVDRFAGTVIDMQARPDGLWITLDPTPSGEHLLKENPYLGVSARIVEQYARADGQFYPAAVQHVLATHDPRITGLGPWRSIEAANTPEIVVDLTNASFAGEEAPMTDLNAQQQANLSKLLNMDPAALDRLVGAQGQPAPQPQTPPADDQLTDQELADLIDALSDDELATLESEFYAETGAGMQTTGLTAEAQMQIDLANSRADETERQLAAFQGQFDAQRFENEKRSLADLGVPPYITELARPLLQGAGHVVDLAVPMTGANGQPVQRVDAGQVMRRVLSEYAKMAQMLDLSTETGSALDEPVGGGPSVADQTRADIVARAKQQMGLG